MGLLDRDASVIGGSVQFRSFDSHADALEALNRARRAEQAAARLAAEVLALNEIGANLQDLARRYQELAQ